MNTEGGFTLVELMIALVLGLLIIAGVVGIFLSNKQAYTTNNALGQVQDNTRVAFELMARDIRQTGLTGCGDLNRVANVLNNGPNNGGTAWYANFGNAIFGYDGNATDPAVTTGTAPANRVAGTSSIELIGASGLGDSVNFDTQPGSSIHINEANSGLAPGDIAIICNPDHAAIFQVTGPDSNNQIVDHNPGNAVTPGNCAKGLGFPTQCAAVGNVYPFPQNSSIFKLAASDWYIGNNPIGGTSLYKIAEINNAGTATTAPQEMVRDVTNMQIAYHLHNGTSYVTAAAVAGNWSQVDALILTLQLQSASHFAATNIATGATTNAITRSVSTTIALRNRLN